MVFLLLHPQSPSKAKGTIHTAALIQDLLGSTARTTRGGAWPASRHVKRGTLKKTTFRVLFETYFLVICYNLLLKMAISSGFSHKK